MKQQATCSRCYGSLQRAGELLSLACRWLWGARTAVEQLDDRREAQELREAVSALRGLRLRQEAAMADGRISTTERTELQQAAAVAERELLDLVAHDQRENELHQEIAHCTEHARASVAPLSRAADRAVAQAYDVNVIVT